MEGILTLQRNKQERKKTFWRWKDGHIVLPAKIQRKSVELASKIDPSPMLLVLLLLAPTPEVAQTEVPYRRY
jgi:hypothetical protein